MHSLRELQEDFLRGVLDRDPGPVSAAIRAGRIPARERLRIYANNCREGFLSALVAGYPVVRRLAGEDYFRQLVSDYQAACPSQAGNLHYSGVRFPGFMEQHFAGTSHEYFGDVARLEWACQEVLIAADHGPLDVQRLAGVPAGEHPRLHFELHPALALVSSPWPVVTIWEAHQQEAEPPAIDLSAGGEQALVRRRDEGIVIYRLARAEYAALAALRAARPLSHAVDAALALDAAFELGAALRRWVSLGIIVNFFVPGEAGGA